MAMTRSAERVPVIVGVGQVNDRPLDPADGLDPIGLMTAALRRADRDAGEGWLPRIDWLGTVKQISFPALDDPAPVVAATIGASPRRCGTSDYPGGDTPIAMLNEAARGIAAGTIVVAAIVGGEALRTAAARAPTRGDPLQRVGVQRPTSLAYRYGLVTPTDVYPLYEHATRAAWRQTLAQAQDESGAIWAGMAAVAADNPDAWLRHSHTADQIVTPAADNRLIAWPYTKLMVANAGVNQGAGFIVTSLAVALAAGVAEDRLVYVGAGAAASEGADYLRRERYDRSTSMAASLAGALSLNALTVEDLDAVELYSCFPCVPKMARRLLGWPVDRAMTTIGGLTFAGGPIGNYMSHAVAGMVERLRRTGRHALLHGNGGYLTKNHAIVLTREPPAPETVLQRWDWQEEADAARGPAPVLRDAYQGRGTVETFTVLYDRAGAPRFGVVIGRTAAGERFLAKVPATDADGIAGLTSPTSEPVGSRGTATAGPDSETIWHIEAVA